MDGETFPWCNMSRNKGFTLLEVLIALGLLAILSAALYGTWFSLVRGRDAAMTAMEGRRELRDTLDMLQREIASAFIVTDIRSTTTPQLSFSIEDYDSFGNPASNLTFFTISPPLSGNQALSDQTKVKYFPIKRDGRLTLAKQVKDLHMEGETAPYPQMDSIESFLVEWSNDGTEWKKHYQTPSALPKHVRVTISVKEGNQTVAFTTVASPMRTQ